MKKILNFSICAAMLTLLFCITTAAQVWEEWVARYNGPVNGDDRAIDLAIDAAGNVYVAGESDQNNSEGDYCIIKYDSSGAQQWLAQYNGPGNDHDEVWSLAVDVDGNVYVTGESNADGNNSGYCTIKYNSAGDQQWVARYDGPVNNQDYAYSVAVDADGNVYVTGGSCGSGTGLDYCTIKYDSAGDQQWVARYNGPGSGEDQARSLAIDTDGNVYVTGESYGSGTGLDNCTIKYNSAGAQQWVARYNSMSTATGVPNVYLALDTDRNVYVTGRSYGSGTNYDYCTIKYNTSGAEQWVAQYDGPGNGEDYAYSLDIDADENVYVTGRSEAVGNNSDYCTIKYNSAGVEQWVARYDGSANDQDYAYSLALDSDRNVYVTGGSAAVGDNTDYCTIKYDSAGAQQWIARYDGSANDQDYAYSLAAGSDGNVYVTGASVGSGTSFDCCTIKYSQSSPPIVLPGEKSVVEFRLYPPSPNPFNPTTTIRFDLPVASWVKLEVFDTQGRGVSPSGSGPEGGLRSATPTTYSAGTHEITFDGSSLPSGMYYYRLTAGTFAASGKMVLMK